MNSYPVARELVLAGGGHSHVIFLSMLGMDPVPGLQVTLISPDTGTPYSGMLPGLIAGHYGEEEAHIDLVPLCRFAGANFIRSVVTGIDLAGQFVLTAQRSPMHYDVLSIDVGSTPSLADDRGGIPVKPISGFLGKWRAFVRRYAAGEVSGLGFVGAGAGGVELCLAARHYLEARFPGRTCPVHIFTDTGVILSEFGAAVRRRFETLLAARQVRVHRHFDAVSFRQGRLCARDARSVNLDEVFWVTQAGAPAWPGRSGLDVDAAGFIRTTDTLQATSHSNVFAVGDCAVMANHPRPRAGVYAVRQGRPLFRNVRAWVLGQRLKPFRPQSRFLSLIGTGSKRAVASRNGLSAEGRWVWAWKDAIDRKFMRRFAELPQMPQDAENALQAEFDRQMHCGGCGSKVSADLLARVLAGLMDKPPADDAARLEAPAGKSLLQSVDHFRSFLNDPYLQARIAVVHALSDIYACGGTPLSAMALLTLPFAKPGATLSLLEQIMRGVLEQLDEEGVALLGGHTSEGMELSMGFAVNGFADPDRLWAKQGLRRGDAIILTKPLGTGAIFAADMQYRAKGEWVAAAVDVMGQSNGRALPVLRDYDVSACTDVTGFGLAGHCREMIRGRPAGIRLDVQAIPLLSGADTCIHELGVTSSLHGANKVAAGLADGGARAEILFDPQTSGGLLFGLPAAQARDCVAALQGAGYAGARVIGKVTDTPGLEVQ